MKKKHFCNVNNYFVRRFGFQGPSWVEPGAMLYLSGMVKAHLGKLHDVLILKISTVNYRLIIMAAKSSES